MGQQVKNNGRPQSVVPPGSDAVDEVSAAVMVASRLFVAISARALADIDPALTLPQLRTLVVLESQSPVKLAALASVLGVNPSTAMRMIDKLEAIGHVDRQVNPDNRREVILRLTADGRRLVHEVLARRHDDIATIVERLPAHQRTGLVQALRALIAAADEPAKDLMLDAALLTHP
ncbi:MarR family winged helix-turn-helix transcriptional regulator [Streptantibioticus rubrisoli]|uniref:MarR family winged helix-turn-helix transcriptional regulator n=1 Tax=Streptantibioticus rubrisoli TaxID=1387313 RepID=A0ABT1PEE3_9ACTN|nr:MarR family winged helix-turn-helix transcriptional regulator [Streptantibioticus rubrisoli]MCQ4043750.1 MarR family winged helix-turn-helix transcriptional regulator [Streptantibioticus rubrisoli]